MNIQDKKPKVLISAYACEPGKGSEPGIGWGWVKQIAEFAETWVMTRANNKEIIEEELKRNPLHNLHFVYLDLPKWISFWKKRQRGIHVYYYLWLLWSYQLAKRLNKTVHFDLAHHLTFGVYSSPSFIALLPIPFIWGPIGGVDTVPKLMRKSLGIKGRLYEVIHDVGHKIKSRLDPFVHVTLRKSSFTICSTKQTFEYMKQFKNQDKVKMIGEIGSLAVKSVPSHRDSCFKIFSAGRLVAWKGFVLAMRAFAKFCHDSSIDSTFEIAGAGYEIKRLRSVARRFGIIEKVSFLRNLPRSEVIERLANSDVFLYASLREGGSSAVVEALSIGKPVVCLDYSGTGEMVTKECGIKVRPVTIEQTIKGLADALLKLADNPDLRKKMGEAARKRAEEVYSWDKKGEFVKKLYESVLSNESTHCP